VALAGVLAAGALTPSCQEREVSSITLAIASEASVPREIDAISLEVRRADRVMFARSYGIDPVSRQARVPGSLTLKLHPDEDPGERIRVVLRAELKQEQVVLRSATTTFVEGKNKLLRMTLRYSCLDYPKLCQAGETCLGGRCQDEFIDPVTLPETPPEEQIFPTINQTGCFDDRDDQCGKGQQALQDLAASAAEGCKFSVVGQQGKLNVFALWAAQLDQGHPVVLDQDKQEGWFFDEESSGVVRLSEGLCEQVQQGKISQIFYNFACPTKTLQTPVCAPLPEAAAVTAFDQSDCHKCAYFTSDCKQLADAEAEEATMPLLDAAKGCPYDGNYSSQLECKAVRACFFDALAPLLSCNDAGCEGKYKAGLAWVACVAELPPPEERCSQECGKENIKICSEPTPGP
jgi:hypothetical protein